MGVGWEEGKIVLLHDFLPQWLPSKIWSRKVINCISEVICTQASLDQQSALWVFCVCGLVRFEVVRWHACTVTNEQHYCIPIYTNFFTVCTCSIFICQPLLLALHSVVTTWNSTRAIPCTKLLAYLVSPVVTWTHINLMNSTPQCITSRCVYRKHTGLIQTLKGVKTRTGLHKY